MIQSKNNWDQDLQDIRTLEKESNNNLLLNELIFARAISALEIFLVESIKDIFIIQPQIFVFLNKTITLHYGEILSSRSLSSIFSKILVNETHQLSRIGFEDVMKFYKKLNIDISNSGPGKTQMLMYHEIRHLIVHRLGEADNRFKKNYNYHKEKIEIDDVFLNKSLNEFEDFVNDTNEMFIKLLTATNRKLKINERRTVIVQVWFDRNSRNEIINSDLFTIRDGDSLYFLSDIVNKRDNLDDSVILTLKSKPSIVNCYLERLEIESKNKPDFSFKVLNVSTQSKGKSKGNYNISEGEFEAVKHLLGDNRTSTDLKNSIALQLKLSNNKVDLAFKKIIKERISVSGTVRL